MYRVHPQPSAPAPPSPPFGLRIFMGPYGLRAGWRFLLFGLIVAALATGLSVATHLLDRSIGRNAATVVGNFLGVITALVAMWILGKVEGHSVWSYGFAAPNRGRNLVAGLATGIVSLSALMGLLTLAGVYKPGPSVLRGADVLLWGLYWALLFAGVSLGEESLTRGYAMFSLAQGIGFWPAAVLLSLLFGAGHLGNRGEEWVGIGNAMLVGLVLAYSVKWSGSLWWAIGYHMTWDWGESFFYGVADSGSKAHHHFLSGDPAGAGWLSGGSVGPEGSVLAIP
ncbi:MAG TPA: type II CAAX endopeptidase family protein, partial [Candidatus Sulfopaludibacter sp.]|nr:type II CAAX endopeptidase family protein [Candidatus Sulfopaludibacter sp.]